MNILKEVAVWVGDNITAPIRKFDAELITGREADIERIIVFSHGGQNPPSHIEWHIVPADAMKQQREAMIMGLQENPLT